MLKIAPKGESHFGTMATLHDRVTYNYHFIVT